MMLKTSLKNIKCTRHICLKVAVRIFNRRNNIRKSGKVENVVLGTGAPLLYGSRSYGTPSFFSKD